jgi:hypothetical protein
MTGPSHYREAEKHALAAFTVTFPEDETERGDDARARLSKWHQRQAQVHATLALAAATALPHAVPEAAWAEVVR